MSTLTPKRFQRRSIPQPSHPRPAAQSGAQAIHAGEISHEISMALHKATARLWIVFGALILLVLVTLALDCNNAAVAFLAGALCAFGARLGMGQP